MSTFYVHRVLEHDAPAWLAVGWREVGRTYPQSLPCADVMIRFDGDEPPAPLTPRAFQDDRQGRLI